MMQKHTPGPWRVAESEVNIELEPWSGAIGIEAPEDEGGNLAVPSVVAWTTRGGPMEANARLIASAPELLAALQEVESHLTDFQCDVVRDPDHDPSVAAALELLRRQVRAAIAKATQP